MCSVPFPFPIRQSALVWLGLALAGCVTTTETRTVGTFASGGPGQYGDPAAGAAVPASAPKGGADYKPSTNVNLKLAELQEQRGYTDDARKRYEMVLAADANSVDAVIGLARLDQIGGRTTEAEAGFQKAVRMDSGSARSLDALGQFYVQQKRWNDALAALQRAMNAAPDDKNYRFHYAVAMAKSGQIESSRSLLMETVGGAATHYNIGLVLHERGELAAAEDEFIAAILENPRMQQAQYWLNEVRRERDHLQAGGNGGGTFGMQSAPGTVVPVAATLVQSPPAAHFEQPQPGYSDAGIWPAGRETGLPNSIEAPPPRRSPVGMGNGTAISP